MTRDELLTALGPLASAGDLHSKAASGATVEINVDLLRAARTALSDLEAASHGE